MADFVYKQHHEFKGNSGGDWQATTRFETQITSSCELSSKGPEMIKIEQITAVS
jgi:hypothetical protein